MYIHLFDTMLCDDAFFVTILNKNDSANLAGFSENSEMRPYSYRSNYLYGAEKKLGKEE